MTDVGILTDTDNTGASVEAWYGDIRFVQPPAANPDRALAASNRLRDRPALKRSDPCAVSHCRSSSGMRRARRHSSPGSPVVATFGKGSRAPSSPRDREPPVTETLPPFKRLEVVRNGRDRRWSRAAGTASRYRRASRKAGIVSAEVHDDTLYLESEDRGRWWDFVLGSDSSRTPQVVVTFEDFDAIEAAGTVKLSAASLKADNLKVDGAGGTSVRIDDLDRAAS